MYKVWIPIMSRKFTELQKKKLVEQLKRVKPQMVMLVYPRILYDEVKKKYDHDIFVANKLFLEQNGFNVGAWIAPTIGYGAPYFFDNDAPYTRLKTLKDDLDTIPGAYCPLYDDFTAELCGIFEQVAKTGVAYILLEDDFTLNGGKASFTRLSCCCEKHMALYREMLGEDITLDELRDQVYNHGGNKYRKLWLQLQGDTLRILASKLEHAVHNVNPDIRIGLSANSSSFNIEGVTLDELSKIIAGKNKPLIRLTGAPYWEHLPSFAANIEAVRLQSEWCDNEIELITEGDTFPRPRHFVPASLLEGYDTVLRADGKTQGILKYMIDYNSSADYETGYIDRHIKNQELYDEIARRFQGGTTVGLNIFETVSQLSDIEFNEDCPIECYDGCGYQPKISQWFLVDNSIPIAYGNKEGAVLVFGESAKSVDDDMLKRGLILDAPAAKILMHRGIDVGIVSLEKAECPFAEYFVDYDETTMVKPQGNSIFYCYHLKENAKVLSNFYVCSDGLGLLPTRGLTEEKNFPACYRYENDKGQKFLVYSFSANTVTGLSLYQVGLFKNYCRQKQLADGVQWLQNSPLPAICFGNPDLYILCKRNGNSLTVGLWNFFADEVMNPEIYLDREYSKIDCYRCEGKLEGNKIRLVSDIPPYGFICFTVK